MKALPLLLAAFTLSISAGPVLALKNIEGCDIVAFAPGRTSTLTSEQWLDYCSKVEAALMLGNVAPATDSPGAFAAGVVAAQKELLALIKASPVYQGYFARDSCRILAGLDAGAVQKLLSEAAATMPLDAAEMLTIMVETARAQIDRIERSARFRSNRDHTLFATQYYCFIAASIVAFLPRERRADIALEDFGDTISCKDAGRTG